MKARATAIGSPGGGMTRAAFCRVRSLRLLLLFAPLRLRRSERSALRVLSHRATPRSAAIEARSVSLPATAARDRRSASRSRCDRGFTADEIIGSEPLVCGSARRF